ncbi:MAG: hypothetical protein GEV08_15360 [Acidimicrobiia bacterium]|nr:hypothetical protein [Acidimicrobiia bacterium]
MNATATLERTNQPRTDQAREDGIVRHLATMQGRSRTLRRQARTVNPVLARAYRRRAAEIQLGAWAYAMRTGHPDEVGRPSG